MAGLSESANFSTAVSNGSIGLGRQRLGGMLVGKSSGGAFFVGMHDAVAFFFVLKLL